MNYKTVRKLALTMSIKDLCDYLMKNELVEDLTTEDHLKELVKDYIEKGDFKNAEKVTRSLAEHNSQYGFYLFGDRNDFPEAFGINELTDLYLENYFDDEPDDENRTYEERATELLDSIVKPDFYTDDFVIVTKDYVNNDYFDLSLFDTVSLTSKLKYIVADGFHNTIKTMPSLDILKDYVLPNLILGKHCLDIDLKKLTNDQVLNLSLELIGKDKLTKNDELELKMLYAEDVSYENYVEMCEFEDIKPNTKEEIFKKHIL